MKRLTWLLLAVICTVLVQVQPMEASLFKAKTCCCCKIPGSCGMPGCCPSPAPSPASLDFSQSARPASLPAARAEKPAPAPAEKFYLSFVEAPADRRLLAASAEAARTAHAPLFKVHCSFLI